MLETVWKLGIDPALFLQMSFKSAITAVVGALPERVGEMLCEVVPPGFRLPAIVRYGGDNYLTHLVAPGGDIVVFPFPEKLLTKAESLSA